MASLEKVAQSIRRVRFSEAGYAGKDEKVVWHSGSDGFDLVSHVDLEGRVLEYELAFRNNVVVWKRDGTVRTGHLSDVDRGDDRPVNPRSGTVSLDSEPRREVLELGALVAGMVPTQDRYLQRLVMVLRAALAGEPTTEHEVTDTFLVLRAPPAEPEKAERVLPRLLKRLFGG